MATCVQGGHSPPEAVARSAASHVQARRQGAGALRHGMGGCAVWLTSGYGALRRESRVLREWPFGAN